MLADRLSEASGVTPDQRFTLIMFALGTTGTVLGWLIRRWIKAGDDSRVANTQAMSNLSTQLTTLTTQVAILTERMASYERDRDEGWRRRR